LQNIDIPFYARKLLPLAALALFLLVVISRNSTLIPWQSLYLEGRLIPFLLTAFILSGTVTFGWLGRQRFALALGRLTYEVYLLHGMFVYLLTKLFPDAGGLFIIVFFWIIPLVAAFMYDLGHRALLKRMKSP
jgi:peptidoglycan/LPS O-acetylase OafA/YrhL